MVSSQTNPLGKTTNLIHDVVARMIATVDATGARTSVTYDLANRGPGTTSAVGQVTSTVYDAVAGPVARIERKGRRASVGCDAGGRQMVDDDGCASCFATHLAVMYFVREAYEAEVRDVQAGRGMETCSPVGNVRLL